MDVLLFYCLSGIYNFPVFFPIKFPNFSPFSLSCSNPVIIIITAGAMTKITARCCFQFGSIILAQLSAAVSATNWRVDIMYSS